ncbi:MAG TPA: hypothetical protein VJZ71_13510 [Phycisphaerae bacterium]|nr:hypothetical protein [Phycisphaerae bacterium]
MLPTFLTQLAAGCYLTISLSAMRQVSWRYLRLIAVVTLVLLFIAGGLFYREIGAKEWAHHWRPLIGMAVAAVAGSIWLFVNSVQADRIGGAQRLCAVTAGLAALATAIVLAHRPDDIVGVGQQDATAVRLPVATTTALGAMLLGSATAAMLLGHRYLTDTGMPIAPLRRLAMIYVGAVIARGAWVIAASVPLWTGEYRPGGDVVWFWLMISVRLGVGILVTGVFAWMAWDCVRRRATQSATALFYLSMILVFLGELAAQFLLRSENLPV